MFNTKRHIRECTSQVLVFDVHKKYLKVLKTKGISLQARRSHCATIYMKSMIVFGGISESGVHINEMACLDLEYNDWQRINYKANLQSFSQATSVSVILLRKQQLNHVSEQLRKSDTIPEGIYYFGGKNSKGELVNKLRFFKPVVLESKVLHGDF